jgi:hypothetical protein
MNSFDFLRNYNKQSQGKNIYVRPRLGNNGNTGLTPTAAVKTLKQALSLATANQNDTVYLMCEGNTAANTTDYLTEPMDWNKDGVHLIGVGVAGDLYLGQRARISHASTTASMTAMFTLSANNCVISGIEFFQSAGLTDLSAAQFCVVVSGMRNVIKNCQISGIGEATLDTVGSASLSLQGAENIFKNCYIGLETIIRAECLSEITIGGSATRYIFEDCIIASYTSATTFKAIVCTHGSAHTLGIIKNTIITNATGRTSVVTTTGAIDPGSIAGHICVLGGGVFGYTNVVTADSSKVLVAAAAGSIVDGGLGTAVDVA